jgi:hypothetical protein
MQKRLWLAIFAASLFAAAGCSYDLTYDCAMNADCPAGWYCAANGICARDCTDSTDCPESQVCNENGQCDNPSADSDTDTDSDSDADTDADSDSDADTDTGCGVTALDIAWVMVDMLLVFDRSNSMCSEDLLTGAAAAFDEVATQAQDQVNFGLMLFPSLVCFETENQCNAPVGALVEVTVANAVDQIGDYLGMAADDCCGGTPIAATLAAAESYLDTVSGELDKSVLLLTDGPPNCDESHPTPCTCTSTEFSCDDYPELCLDDVDANNAAEDLLAAGYPVYVLGIGESLGWQSVMDQIAYLGGTGSSHLAESSAEIATHLEVIVCDAVSCKLDVDWESLPEDASEDPGLVNLYGDGDVIYYDDGCADGLGWEWVDGDTVKLCEQACQIVTLGGVDSVTATFGCESET